jgi:hypothetical protein
LTADIVAKALEKMAFLAFGKVSWRQEWSGPRSWQKSSLERSAKRSAALWSNKDPSSANALSIAVVRVDSKKDINPSAKPRSVQYLCNSRSRLIFGPQALNLPSHMNTWFGRVRNVVLWKLFASWAEIHIKSIQCSTPMRAMSRIIKTATQPGCFYSKLSRVSLIWDKSRVVYSTRDPCFCGDKW